MARVWVYRFEVPDPQTGKWSRAPYYATRQHIDSVGGAPNFQTKTAVDDSLLDAAEICWLPPKAD